VDVDCGVALVLYVLSTGPVCRLCDKGLVPQRIVETVYLPVIYVGDRFSIPHDFLSWYVHDLWKAM